MTIREIIKREYLNPSVRRDNGDLRGDLWETFFRNGELDEAIIHECHSSTRDLWRSPRAILIDTAYQSLLSPR